VYVRVSASVDETISHSLQFLRDDSMYIGSDSDEDHGVAAAIQNSNERARVCREASGEGMQFRSAGLCRLSPNQQRRLHGGGAESPTVGDYGVQRRRSIGSLQQQSPYGAF
jgi:hypothetical protein